MRGGKVRVVVELRHAGIGWTGKAIGYPPVFPVEGPGDPGGIGLEGGTVWALSRAGVVAKHARRAVRNFTDWDTFVLEVTA